MVHTLDGSPLAVTGTRLLDFGRFVDDRGLLIVGDQLPFGARRIFTVQGVPDVNVVDAGSVIRHPTHVAPLQQGTVDRVRQLAHQDKRVAP